MSRKLTYDTYLFGAAMLIVVVGMVMIYSASAIITMQKVGSDNPYYFITRQLVWLIAGSAVMVTLMHLDVVRLRDRRIIYAGVTAVLIALVIVLFQSPINGTHRWIVLSHFQLQPSEFAKPAVILFLASYLARKEERINELTSTLLPLALIVALFAGLILLEPDFGTATTLVLVAAGMIFAAGVSWMRVVTFALMIIPAGVLLVFSAAYRRDRLFTFINPEA
ncbi:MAG TPA: FtsW/RodA/SpoVE family cell cycle protein, partial [Thermoanaerobaculia bacterium]|nr:FtsW/RodA/SpoVE family cell cycle protein [Thermoanaerobaculia bacterium]